MSANKHCEKECRTDNITKYTCHSCGNEFLVFSDAELAKCPFCGSEDISDGKFTGELLSDTVLAYKIDKESAKDKVLGYLKKKRFVPDIFKDPDHLDELKDVYIPFWVFNQKVMGNMVFKCEKNRDFSNSDTDYTETSVYNVSKSGELDLRNITICAQSGIPTEYVDSIGCFDTNGIKGFSKDMLDGHIIGKYDITKGEARKKAEEISKDSLNQIISDSVKEYDSISTLSENIKILSTKSFYVLMPAWFMSTIYNGQNYMIMVNGQTGKTFGNIPQDDKKYKRLLLIIAAAAGLSISVVLSLLFL